MRGVPLGWHAGTFVVGCFVVNRLRFGGVAASKGRFGGESREHCVPDPAATVGSNGVATLSRPPRCGVVLCVERASARTQPSSGVVDFGAWSPADPCLVRVCGVDRRPSSSRLAASNSVSSPSSSNSMGCSLRGDAPQQGTRNDSPPCFPSLGARGCQ